MDELEQERQRTVPIIEMGKKTWAEERQRSAPMQNDTKKCARRHSRLYNN